MDDNAPKENPPPDFNKLDLTQLQGFSFGTQWTQEKPSAPDRRDRGEPGERPRREDRREGGGPDRRDRRAFRRPAGGPDQPGPGSPAGGGGGAGGGQERRDYAGDRRPPQGGDFRGGGPRREGHGDRGPRQYGQYGRGPQERGPYESPYYNVTFYPEDSSFSTLVQTIRKSCRTVELFEIARTVVAKPDRFVVVVAHRMPAAGAAPAERAGNPAAAGAAKPVFHISVPDGMPFESDEAAIAHVLSRHLDKFFEMAEVEVDPPKGNFQVINRCGVTGELLGPPNYHRYNQIVQQHYAAKVARMPFEAFRSRIETIRDPEVVSQWLAKMKKATRYTWKLARAGQNGRGGEAAAPASADAAPTAAPADAAPEVEAAAPAQAAPPSTPVFDTLEDARLFLLTHARDKVVRTAEMARFHGKIAETLPPGEIRRATEGALERQRKFPLDTANALRGRLRREHFTIFKKGSKGISYVCAVKRKFRIPGQRFADSIGALITFIETNPMIRAGELPVKFLGIKQVPPPKPAEAPPASADSAPVPAPARIEPELSIEDRARMARMQADLMWLVREGYVTEFIDGRLFAPPPMVEARKKEVEAEDHDPENFPEPPATPEPSPEAPPAATAAAPASEPGAAPTAGEPARETDERVDEPAPSEPPPAKSEPVGEAATAESAQTASEAVANSRPDPAPVADSPVAEPPLDAPSSADAPAPAADGRAADSRPSEPVPASGEPVTEPAEAVAPAAAPAETDPQRGAPEPERPAGAAPAATQPDPASGDETKSPETYSVPESTPAAEPPENEVAAPGAAPAEAEPKRSGR